MENCRCHRPEKIKTLELQDYGTLTLKVSPHGLVSSVPLAKSPAGKTPGPSCHMSVLETLPELSHEFIERIATVQEGYRRPFSDPESLNL